MHTHIFVHLTGLYLCLWYVIVIPMYNVHLSYVLKNVDKKVHIIHSKIQYYSQCFTGHLQTCADHEKIESLNAHIPSWGQTRQHSVFLFQQSYRGVPEVGGGRGQCNVLQETLAMVTVAWGLNPNSHPFSGVALGESLNISEPHFLLVK